MMYGFLQRADSRMSMLGQSVALQSDHVYRARAYFELQPGTTCQSYAEAVRDLLVSQNVAGGALAAGAVIVAWRSQDVDAVVRTTRTDPWPSTRFDIPGLCPVWIQMQPGPVGGQFDVALFASSLRPIGGSLIDFWDETNDVVIYESAIAPSPVAVAPMRESKSSTGAFVIGGLALAVVALAVLAGRLGA